jgi:hypothetical protein
MAELPSEDAAAVRVEAERLAAEAAAAEQAVEAEVARLTAEANLLAADAARCIGWP